MNIVDKPGSTDRLVVSANDDVLGGFGSEIYVLCGFSYLKIIISHHQLQKYIVRVQITTYSLFRMKMIHPNNQQTKDRTQELNIVKF